MAEKRVITLGGKGSALTSSSIHAISTGRAQLRLDSAAVDRLSSDSAAAPAVSYNLLPSSSETLTTEESMASLTVLLNHLLLSTAVRASLPLRIVDFLNSDSEGVEVGPIEVSEEERSVLERSSSTILGVCAILEHELTAMSVIADAVAALSCEAMKASVGEAFNVMDSGDGSVSKDEVGVASDMKVLLNGSKLVGKVACDAVLEIPEIHGSLRKQLKLLHSEMRIGLKSLGPKGRRGAKEVARVLLPLEDVLRDLGRSSLCRVGMNLNSIVSDCLRSDLTGLFKSKCPNGDCLKQVQWTEDSDKFVHEVYVLSGAVWRIVVWEAVTAFVALEGIEIGAKGGDAEVSEANGKAEKKNDKKKKKVVLGKGTSVMLQLIKDRLQSKGFEAADSLSLLAKWAEDLGSFLNPKDTEFDCLLTKVKEIVETNESRRLPKLPKGTRDFAKEQMAIRERAFTVIGEVFKRHGATALDTPVFEMRETLMGKYGEDSKLIYDLADQGGELCSLRYDLTVPFARYMAMNGLTSFKRYQIAKVYRRDNPSKGRFREFYQCDFDIAGQFELMGPDFEVVKIMTELLDELNIGEYEVKLNHRKLLDGMLEICGVPPEKFRTICSSIDKLDKQSFEKIKKELVEEKGLSSETADRIGTFVKERGQPLELLNKLKQEGSEFLKNKSSEAALKELEILFKALEKAKCVDKVVFDLSLARGLDYYTGVIFEAVFKGSTQVGSIGGGGRYDGLIGMFGTKQVPAVGVSLGIERVFTIMEEQLQKNQNQIIRATETQVLVGILGDDLSQAAELVNELWSAKLKAEFMANKRPMKHIDRAKGSRIPYLVIVGEQEAKAGVVKLKDIEASKEDEIPRNNLVQELKRRLGQN